MKKFLSLVLALVMTMSLVTVSAGAKDFTDNGKINYDEAVAVMSAVKVIDGYADGSFNPQGSLTRGAAAKIICNLILGPTTAAELHADTAPYKDVPVDHTFAGYIAYCAKEGIISGYADGAFRPAAPLTGYAFQKMLLGALGYESDIEGFVGANWSINVAKRALNIGLNKGLQGEFNGVKAVTREEACLYALNTLTATMVEYDSKIVANVGGAQVTVGTSVAKDVKWNIASKTDGNIKDDNYVQFAEKYFPKLELDAGNGMYGRAANTWKNAKKLIGTFTSIEPTYVYTEGTEEKAVYKDLGKEVVTEYDWTAYVNGKEVDVEYPDKNSTDEYVFTGEGTVTELYVDDDAETVTVIEYNYYLGQVSKVKSDDDGEYITVNTLSKGAKLNDRTFYVEGYSEDDYVVFTVNYNDEDGYVIGEVVDPEVVTAEVTRVDEDKDTGATYLKADGSKYVYSEDATKPAQQSHMVYDLAAATKVAHPTLNKEYNLYLDPNGYVLAFEDAEETVDQYLYVTDADEHLGTWEAKVVLADGSTEKVELKKDLKKIPEKTDGFENINDGKIGWLDDASVQHSNSKANIVDRIWKYSVSDKGVYTLTYVENIALMDDEIHNGKAYIEVGKNNYIVDKKTVFVDMDGETAYTGYKEVPNIDNAAGALVVDKRVGVIAFIVSGDIYDTNNIYFMLTAQNRESLKYDDEHYWEYSKAYVNGDKQSVIVNYDWNNDGKDDAKLEVGKLYHAKKVIDEQYIVEVEEVKATSTIAIGAPYAVGSDAFWLGETAEKKYKFDVDEDTVFVTVEIDVDGDYAISEGDLNDMDQDAKDYDVAVWVVKATNDDNTARLVYTFLTEKEDGKDPGTEVPDKSIKVTVENGVITVEAPEDAKTDAIANAIVKELAKKGYDNVNVIVEDGDVNGATATKGSITYTFKMAE